MAKKKKDKNKIPDYLLVKDDGTRWLVVDKQGQRLYPGNGVSKREAMRLSEGLLIESEIIQVV